MRLIAQAKQGFYRAPREAVAGVLRHLNIPDPPPDPKFNVADVNILDPCAGEANALVQLAEGVGVSKDHVHAVELNARRAATIAELARLGEPQFSRWRHAEPDTTSRKPELDTWELPFSRAPKRFQKTALTDEELERELARSLLYAALCRRIHAPLKRPPLSLNKGHASLLLMTGMLDGYVPSSPPHVVRGLTSKVEKLHRTECYETPTGDAVTKQVFSESPIPIVRAVWPDGTIRTFSDQVGNEDVQLEDQEPELEEE